MNKIIIAGVMAVLGTAYAWERSGQPSLEKRSELVPIVSANEILQMIGEGKRVLFVDAREQREWMEERIPGAINVTLRDVASIDPVALGDPDLVIAYCVKDFRGLEVAKAFQKAGFPQAGILEELGLNGWKSLGLPVTLAGRIDDQQGIAALAACARDRTRCLGQEL